MTWNNFCLHWSAHTAHTNTHSTLTFIPMQINLPAHTHTHTYCHSFPNWIETLPCDIYISNNRRLLRGPAAPISQHRMGNCYFGTEVLPVCVLKCDCVCVCARRDHLNKNQSKGGEFIRDLCGHVCKRACLDSDRIHLFFFFSFYLQHMSGWLLVLVWVRWETAGCICSPQLLSLIFGVGLAQFVISTYCPMLQVCCCVF